MALVLNSTPNHDYPPVDMAAKTVNIFFRFVDGQTLCLDLDPCLRIKAIKKALLEHRKDSKFYVGDLFFVWNGKPLDDDFLLRDYLAGCKQNVTVHVSYRNTGGCFMVSCTILFTIILAAISSLCTCGLSLVVIPFLLPLLFILPLFCL